MLAYSHQDVCTSPPCGEDGLGRKSERTKKMVMIRLPTPNQQGASQIIFDLLIPPSLKKESTQALYVTSSVMGAYWIQVSYENVK